MPITPAEWIGLVTFAGIALSMMVYPDRPLQYLGAGTVICVVAYAGLRAVGVF